MALSSWANGDLFSALRDKFNLVVIFLIGGTIGQLPRSNGTGDPTWTSEFAYKCAATSASTSVATNNVSVVFTIPESLQFTIGNRVRATGSAGNWVEGIVTAYSTTSLTVLVDTVKGTGLFTAWEINIASKRAIKGYTEITSGNIDTTEAILLTLVPSTVLASEIMTLSFSINFTASNSGVDAYTFRIKKNGTLVKSVQLSTSSGFIITTGFFCVTSYAAGDIITVTGQTASYITGTVPYAILMAESNDAK